MLIECVKAFEDYENGNKLREVGERWEVTPKRFEAINSTKWGTLAKAVSKPRRTRKKAE